MDKEINELYTFLLTILPSSMSRSDIRCIAKQIIFAGYMKIDDDSVVFKKDYAETLKIKTLWKIKDEINNMINGVIDGMEDD